MESDVLQPASLRSELHWVAPPSCVCTFGKANLISLSHYGAKRWSKLNIWFSYSLFFVMVRLSVWAIGIFIKWHLHMNAAFVGEYRTIFWYQRLWFLIVVLTNHVSAFDLRLTVCVRSKKRSQKTQSFSPLLTLRATHRLCLFKWNGDIRKQWHLDAVLTLACALWMSFKVKLSQSDLNITFDLWIVCH